MRHLPAPLSNSRRFFSLGERAAYNFRRMKFSFAHFFMLFIVLRAAFFLPLAHSTAALGVHSQRQCYVVSGQKFCFAAQCDDIVLFRASGVGKVSPPWPKLSFKCMRWWMCFVSSSESCSSRTVSYSKGGRGMQIRLDMQFMGIHETC